MQRARGIFKGAGFSSFEGFKRTAEGGEKESFEVWDDYLAWPFAEEARKFWMQEVQGLDALGTEV